MATDTATSLPKADLRRWPVPAATLHRLPKEVAQEFEAAFYDESPDFLYLGLVHPELMKETARAALTTLESQLGKKIILTQITDEQFQRLLALYQPVAAEPVQADWPPNWRSGDPVDEALLTMLPVNFCREHHVVPVSFTEPNTLWLGTDQPTNEEAALADLIGRRNRLNVRAIPLDSGEFNRVLDLIRAAEPISAPATEASTDASAETAPSKVTDAENESTADEITADEIAPEVADEAGVAGDMIVPKIAGRIVSSDVEKSGLSGIMQRAGLILSQKDAPADTADKPAEDNADIQEKREDDATDEAIEAPAASAAPTAPTMPAEPVVKAAEPAPKIAKVTLANDEGSKEGAALNAKAGVFERPVTDIKQLENIVRQGSVIRIVAAMVNLAAQRRASDVHIEPYGDELVVRYRVDGQLGEVIKLPMELQPPLVSRIKILAKLKLDETRVPQDGRFDVKVGDKEIDIRVSTLPTVHGEKVVLRLLDKSSGLITLENLGLKGDAFERLIQAIQKTYGVVLSTGPTGSGKTTTLYAILQRVATTNVNVVTLEDPVEYEIRGINQSQIKPKIGFTFADGLRSILRQDPNVIMVGEVRDGETASMVTHAALTGHLVLSTLHTNDASGALPRLTNMGIEPFLITSAMNAVVGQRLVRRLEDETKERVELPETIRREIDAELEAIRKLNPKEAERIPAKIEFFRPRPSQDSPTGYKGRVGLYEVMTMDTTIEDLAVKHAPADEIKKAAQASGMISMRQDGILKVLEGVTSIDEVWHETSNR